MVARVLVYAAAFACALARPDLLCDVAARTDAGWVCGLQRVADDGAVYASFRGVPYAKQPLGELRFKELEQPEPWDYVLDATEEGPICFQTDVIYGRIMQPRGMSEACIHANIHVPIEALPGVSQRLARELQPPYRAGLAESSEEKEDKGVPILVFIHGGGFMSGSGDSDLHGPEYLVSKNVIVITFNYRVNVFGFLSLNSAEVPGNQGLRDQVTLLRWVQRNARAFGGDPDNVTLMGQSAGASSAHLLTLSDATQGLFKRAVLMSGTGISGFFSTMPMYSVLASQLFLGMLGINTTDAASAHRQLIEMPVEKINDAHAKLLDMYGLVTFTPTVEAAFPGITRVLDDHPEALMAKGRGKDIPLTIGFTDVECEVFRPRLEQIDIASRIVNNSLLNVPVNTLFTTPPEALPLIIKKVDLKYYNGTISTQGFIDYCTDAFYKYPALKLAEKRSSTDAAPVFLYQFAYNADHSVLRNALGLNYKGAAHIEDLTYVFKTTSMLGSQSSYPPLDRDDYMRDWMTNIIVGFMHCSNPVCNNESKWPAASSKRLQFQDIVRPAYNHRDLTPKLKDILEFFDNL